MSQTNSENQDQSPNSDQNQDQDEHQAFESDVIDGDSPSRDSMAYQVRKYIGDGRYNPQTITKLSKSLGIEEKDLPQFQQVIETMAEDKKIVISSRSEVRLAPPGREMTGTLRLNAKGFGFLIPDSPSGHGDFFVPPGKTGDALDGDKVKVEIGKDPMRSRGPGKGKGGGKGSSYVATVVEIMERCDHRFAGALFKKGKQWYLRADGKRLSDPILIRDAESKNPTTDMKVVVELTKFPESGRYGDKAEGVITEILGEAGLPDVETQATIAAYGLADRFSQEILTEARDSARTFDEAAFVSGELKPDDPKLTEELGFEREDLRDKLILTIDPPDAKDYDDAISIDKLEDQPDSAVFELGVHIADVSSFVKEGTTLDEEAFSRGNSTYLPRLVLPMLPELLSNGVCSLQEGVPRYTTSVFIRYTEDGKVISSRFCKGLIQSKKRFTYLEAQAIIDKDLREAVRHAKTEPKYPRDVVEKLQLMDELAKIILQRRRDDGMIELALPESELIFDEAGHVVDAEPEDDAFTHRVIEMFMVEANEAAARLFERYNTPMIRRIHPEPPVHDANELRFFAKQVGMDMGTNPDRKQLQRLLTKVQGTPAQHTVHLAILQTLSRAEYAPLSIGHYALASDHYTHFTSPIRRYTDLIVHRGIASYLKLKAEYQKDKGKKRASLTRQMQNTIPGEDALTEIAIHCSTTERNSESAEKDLRTFLLLQLISQMMGEQFGGTITGVSGRGAFVQLDKYLIDGVLTMDELSNAYARGERWRLDRATGMLTSDTSGYAIKMGDRIDVVIAAVDPVQRTLELAVKTEGRTRNKKGRENQAQDREVFDEFGVRVKSGRRKIKVKTGEGKSDSNKRKKTKSSKGRSGMRKRKR